MEKLSNNNPEDELVRVRFSAMAAGGDAVGRDVMGRVIFVPYAAPDDEAEVRITQRGKAFAKAQLLRLIAASPQRVPAPCPFYRPPVDEVSLEADESWRQRNSCGGCQIQHLSYAAQLREKRDVIVQALARIGGLGGVVETLVAPCVASPQQFSYRNKADYVIASDELFSTQSAPVGFFAPQSHHAVDIAQCLIQTQPNNAVLAALRVFVAQSEAHDVAALESVVVRTSSRGETIVIAQTKSEDWPQSSRFAALLQARVPSLVGVLQRSSQVNHANSLRLIAGRDWLEEEVDGLLLRVRGDGFFQVNTALTPLLLQTALRLADIGHGERTLDLYCGVGLFALAMARQGAQVCGVEANPGAVDEARGNAKRNNLKVEFLAGDAARVLRRGEFAHERPEVVLLDPPRAGAADCVRELLRLRPRRMVYVSCDPATLGRDVKSFVGGGYVVREVVPLDMFPQTAHVETVLRLDDAA